MLETISTTSDFMDKARCDRECDDPDSLSCSAKEQSDASSDDFHLISVSKAIVLPVAAKPGSLEMERAAHDNEILTSSKAKSEVGAQSKGQGQFSKVGEQVRQNESDIGPDSDHLRQWVQTALANQRESGSSFSDMVRGNRNFRNPAILEKMISYCGIDEFGTQLQPEELLEKYEFYDVIADFQEICAKESL